MLVNFYTFYKRINSTKQPEGDGLQLECQLKESCSVLTPVIITSGSGTITDYNYVYIQKWKKYYFITDTTILTGNRYEVALSCDELASWKNSIGRYTCFVERAASSYNSRIRDNLLSSTTNIVNSVIASSDLSSHFEPLGGFYVMRTVGGGSQSTTGITSYCLTASQVRGVLSFMFTESNFTDVISDATVKSFFNPFQYIVDLKWLPLNYDDYSATLLTEENVKFGWWESDVTGKIITSGFAGQHFQCDSITLPGNSYSDWRRYSDSFSDYNIYLPGIGTLDLSAQETAEGLCCRYDIDITTGICQCSLYSGSMTDGENPTGVLIATYTSTVGVPIQLGQLDSSMLNVISDMGGALKSAITGNIFGAISSGISAVQDGLNPSKSVNGTVGARYILLQNQKILVTLNNLGSAAYPTTVAGRPLCQNVQLSTLSGFIQCGGASIDIGGYQGEKDTVNGYLNGGFYYE